MKATPLLMAFMGSPVIGIPQNKMQYYFRTGQLNIRDRPTWITKKKSGWRRLKAKRARGHRWRRGRGPWQQPVGAISIHCSFSK